MPPLDRPKLRHLSVQRFEQNGETYALLQDPLGAFPEPLLIPYRSFVHVCRHFDGRKSVDEIRTHVRHETGQSVTDEELARLIDQLDRALVLDGPAFAAFEKAFRESPRRPAALAGRSYAGDERALRIELDGYFRHACGSGPVGPEGRDVGPPVRGILSPHIDFRRGGATYTWAYKALAGRTRADTFVVIGVAHQSCRRRFVMTYKDFETPLGLVPTDREYVERIARRAGSELFDDELVHLGEHSIEFQLVFLKHVLGAERPFSVVPILAGSFHDCMERGIDPIDDPDVRRFVEALRNAERDRGREVAYIGGVDFCHVGPEFGDPDPVDGAMRDRVRTFDAELLEHAAAVRPGDWFGTAARVANRYRVCGLAATYTMLQAMGPARGRLLRYDQAVNGERTCCVSFASMVYHAEGA